MVRLIPGAFNLVLGKGSEIGDLLVSDAHVAVVNFTGGTAVGQALVKKAPLCRLVLEMGGKDAAIVTRNNHDLAKIAHEIVQGAFLYSGQRCTAIKRILVDYALADALVPYLVASIEKLSMGNPFDNCDIVPLINQASFDYNLALIADAKTHQAQILTGGEGVGYNLLAPTLIDHVPLAAQIAWEEPFGPILPIIRFNTKQEAIRIANNSTYGLQASVFCDEEKEFWEIAKQLEVGTVN